MTKKGLLLPLALAAAVSVAVPAAAYNDSDPNDYITERFDVRGIAHDDHTIDITETITVDFVQPHHGISRDIPLASDNTYMIENLRTDGYKYQINNEDGFKFIVIGDEHKTLTGEHTYVVSYTLRYFADNDNTADFLAQNMLPTGWQTSIREASVSLTMPSPVDWSKLEIYGGAYGSKGSDWQDRFTVNIDEAANTVSLTGSDIPKKYGLTIRHTALPNGYWSNAELFEKPLGIFMPLALILALLGMVGAVAAWFTTGRSPKLVKPVEFYPPDNITPAEIGYALDEEITDQEMMTMVLYFANKGYLRIREYKKKKYEFIKSAEIDESEPEFAKTLFNGLFSGKDTVRANKIPTSFYKKLQNAKEKLQSSYKKQRGQVISPESFVSRILIVFGMLLIAFAFVMLASYSYRDIKTGLFASAFTCGTMLFGSAMICSGIQHRRVLTIIIGAVLFIASLVGVIGSTITIFGAAISGALVVVEIIMMVFAVMTNARTKENADLVGRILGFKEFLRTAELDRLRTLIETDPQYCYKMLPYAAVLGLDTAWAKKLTQIHVPQPFWYDTYDGAAFVYSTMWYHSMMRSCTHDSIPHAPSSGSGSSYGGGFSGGGFSGGGGGGGGGGAW